MANNVEVTIEKLQELMNAVAKIEAVKAYYNATDYPDEDIMADILGIPRKAKKGA